MEETLFRQLPLILSVSSRTERAPGNVWSDHALSPFASQMKIAIIRSSSSVLDPKSYNIQELGLAKALLDFDISTDVYMAGRGKHPETETVCKKNGNAVKLELLPFLELPGRQAVYPDLFTLMDRERYDLLQVHEDSQITSVRTALYGRSRAIPVVLCQGMYRNYEGVVKRLVQNMYDRVMLRHLRNNTVLCIAKTGRARDYLLVKKFKNIRVCPVGLDTGKFAEHEPVDWKRRYGLAEDSNVLLYVGSIEKRRDVHFLITALRRLLQSMPDLYLFIAGDGPERGRCEELVAQLNLREKVLFLGTVSQKQLPSLYTSAYLFLMPSRYEIYGMVMLESMYFGLPVISTSTAGSDEILTDGVEGQVIRSWSSGAWEEALRGLLLDRDRRNAMGACAREAVMSKYVWEEASLRYHDAYLRAIREYGKGKGSPRRTAPCGKNVDAKTRRQRHESPVHQ